MIIVLTIVLLFILVLQLRQRNCGLISLPTVSVIAFLFAVLPKMLIYQTLGVEALIAQQSYITPGDIAAAEVVIFAFLFTIQLVYAIHPGGRGKVFGNSRAQAPRLRHRISRVRTLTVAVFFPASIIFLAYFAMLKGSSLLELFAKAEFWDEFGTELTDIYFAQKLGFFVKIPFYMILFKIVSTGRMSSGDTPLLVLATLFSLALFLFSGQRSGIMLTVLELFLVLQACGRLRTRVLFGVMGFFVLANVLILYVRLAGALDTSAGSVLLRRYFFDVEKIGGIISFASGTNWSATNPVWILFDQSINVKIDKHLHLFIAEIFNYHGGVPPSVVGEMLIYAGGWAVVPCTAVLALATRHLERTVLRTNSALYVMIYALILSHFYYFSLNSDMASFVRRLVLDLLILGAGVVVYSTFNALTRQQRWERRPGPPGVQQELGG